MTLMTEKDFGESMGRRGKSENNVFFWSKGCPFCKKVWKALNLTKLNARLDPHRRLKPIEVTTNRVINPTLQRYKPLIEGTPTLVLDRILYKGATTIGYYKGVFKAHFEDEVLTW